MVTVSHAYTPAEAAAVSEIAIKSVHNAIDNRQSSVQHRGPSSY